MNNQYPVVLFVFKRPSTTKILLDLIVSSGIDKMYIFADGPKNEQEKVTTDIVRKIIVDFSKDNPEIRIQKKFFEVNQGLKQTITDGLNHVFQKESAAIILEDDCLPSEDFFRFTTTMLTKYASKPQIMSVAGTSIGSFSDNSYDFSRYQLCWGWATWARAWDLYDPKMRELGSANWGSTISRVTRYPHMRKYWDMMLNIVQSGWLKTWDYQWTYSVFVYNGLAVIPGCNLVSNIGFDKSATNTKVKSSLSNMAQSNLQWPLIHPKSISENYALSKTIENRFYNNPVAILGMLRQYIYWKWSQHASRH